MDLLTDVITQTLGNEVLNYLTIAEARQLGVNVSLKRLNQIADAYPTTVETFIDLAGTLEGNNIIHAKLVLGEIPYQIPTDIKFYRGLDLSHKVLNRYVKTAINLIPQALEHFIRLMMRKPALKDLILSTVVKYGVSDDILNASRYRLSRMNIVGLAIRGYNLKAIKRLVRYGYKISLRDLDVRSSISQHQVIRTPTMVAFLVDELLGQPDFVQTYYTKKWIEAVREVFNQVLVRPDIDNATKCEILHFIELHPISLIHD